MKYGHSLFSGRLFEDFMMFRIETGGIARFSKRKETRAPCSGSGNMYNTCLYAKNL